MNAAVIFGSSWKMISNEFQKVRDFLNKTFDALEVSHEHSGDRVAMVSHHGLPGAKRNQVELEI